MSHGTWVWLPTSYHWRGGQECYAPCPTAWLKVNQAGWNFHGCPGWWEPILGCPLASGSHTWLLRLVEAVLGHHWAGGSHHGLSTLTSPPASPRFPSNHGSNFENSGSLPHIPQTIPRSVPTSSPPMQFANSSPPSLVPVRPAPSAPSIAKAVNLIPTRAAPPRLPPSSHRKVDYGRPSMDAVSRSRSQSNAADEVSQDLKPSRPGFKMVRSYAPPQT
ncbi:hypothetical protein XPA_001959 [Xanthoria parietina]